MLGRNEGGAVEGTSQRSRSQEEELVEDSGGLIAIGTGVGERLDKGGREESRLGGIMFSGILWVERRRMRE